MLSTYDYLIFIINTSVDSVRFQMFVDCVFVSKIPDERSKRLIEHVELGKITQIFAQICINFTFL